MLAVSAIVGHPVKQHYQSIFIGAHVTKTTTNEQNTSTAGLCFIHQRGANFRLLAKLLCPPLVLAQEEHVLQAVRLLILVTINTAA